MGIRSPSQPSDADSISKEICHENGEPAAILDSYSAWLAKHPSALDTFDRMIAAAKGKKIVVFLDYDGTLSPIVEDPDKAFMSDTMRMAVHEVAHFFPTAIVSGRCLDKVSRFVQLKNVVYAGSHGMDISTPAGSLKQNNPKHETRTVDEQGNEVVHFQPAQEFLPQIQEMIQVLEEKIKTIKGATVEDNKFCISVHFRRVDEDDINTLQEMVNSIVEAYPNFRISGGKKVMEIRPCIDWDKGRALEYLLDTFGFNNASDFLPLYIGDDKTDEDAFKVIRHMGRGYPIIVSSVPRETKALYSLRDPDEVMSFLRRLARWKKSLGIP
ncbi:putative trehalose-phosphate phosphatase D [Citrus sinensis]|nr:probable trehalose-phosphate phosphatase D [Citrus sinensis]XP_052292779.1 probable trehalose-phosphate phosphatase D [Citrus sinensis]KAH9732307.1 putative trehalose-phosphate phosphatase D [Citrus sinensis]